jgi:uridine kinase
MLGAALCEEHTMPNCLVVGIAGGSASGKSTLAAALAAALEREGTAVISIMADRYMRRERPGAPTFLSPSTGVEMFNANHPESVDWAQLLSDLDARLAAVERDSVVLVEGLMVLHQPRMRERLGLRLFVELDADERALRRLLRDMSGVRGSRDPQFIATYYRECARVGHAQYVEPSRVHADLIIRGDAPWERVEPLLLAAIDRLMQAATDR